MCFAASVRDGGQAVCCASVAKQAGGGGAARACIRTKQRHVKPALLNERRERRVRPPEVQVVLHERAREPTSVREGTKHTRATQRTCVKSVMTYLNGRSTGKNSRSSRSFVTMRKAIFPWPAPTSTMCTGCDLSAPSLVVRVRLTHARAKTRATRTCQDARDADYARLVPIADKTEDVARVAARNEAVGRDKIGHNRL